MQGDINELICKNKGLVYKQLHRFYLVHDFEAESIAYEALYNAILNYDSTKNVAFSTVATVYMYNALGCYVRHLNRQKQIKTVSYNNIVANGEGGEYLELLDAGISLEKNVIQKELQDTTRLAFKEQYERLTNDKHKRIIKFWDESDFVGTTVDIAKKVGVSQSYASQIINNFKASLRKRLEERYYD